MVLSMLQISDRSKNMLMSLELHDFFAHMEDNKEDNRILALSYMLHEKQKDKADIDYIIHLMHVSDIALGLKEEMGCSHLSNTTIIQACLLHDSKEDDEPEAMRQSLNITQEQLYAEYDIHKEAIIAIDDVTRKNDETYYGFIDRVVQNSESNPLSRLLKVSDILSNTNDIRCNEMPLNNGLLKRYDKALKRLGYHSGPKPKNDYQFSPL